jgi:hypothetical protein
VGHHYFPGQKHAPVTGQIYSEIADVSGAVNAASGAVGSRLLVLVPDPAVISDMFR